MPIPGVKISKVSLQRQKDKEEGENPISKATERKSEAKKKSDQNRDTLKGLVTANPTDHLDEKNRDKSSPNDRKNGSVDKKISEEHRLKKPGKKTLESREHRKVDLVRGKESQR